MNAFHRWLLLASFGAYFLVGERAVLEFSTGGRGVLPVLNLLFPFLVFTLVVLPSPQASTGFLQSGPFWFFWGPYLVLSVFLPLFGVVVMHYPVRSLLAIVQPLGPVSCVCLGFRLAGHGSAASRTFRSFLFWAILCESVYAVAVCLQKNRVLNVPVLQSLSEWDALSQLTYGNSYELNGRAIGTFINPNVLGFWAALAFWASLVFLRGWRRLLAISGTLIVLAISQSRGSLFAWAASCAVAVGSSALRPILADYQGRPSPARRTQLGSGAVIGFVLVVVLVGATVRLAFADVLVSSGGLDRLGSGLDVLSEGGEADANFSGRELAWDRALDLYHDYPFGTLGPPEFILDSFIDNDYVRVLLQGGPLYLLSFLLVRCGGGRLILRDDPESRFLSVTSVVIAVNSMTMLPLLAAPTALYWLIAGSHLAHDLRGRTKGMVASREAP